MKTVTIVQTEIAQQQTLTSSFDLALIDGCEPAALESAVQQRIAGSFADDDVDDEPLLFYLTAGPDPSDVVVPLTCSLPDKMKVYLHRSINNSFIATNSVAPTKEPSSNQTNETSHLNAGSVPEGSKYMSIEADDDEPPTSLKERTGSRGSVRMPTKEDVDFWKKVYLEGKLPDPEPSHHGNKQNLPRTRTITPKKEDNNTTSRKLISYNQIGTDLANERTLLAWVRTLLSCVRTIFAYEKLDLSHEGMGTLIAATMMTATLLLLAGINAGYRYFQVRKMLYRKDKPETYSRSSLMPFILLAMATAFLTSIETYRGSWE